MKILYVIIIIICSLLLRSLRKPNIKFKLRVNPTIHNIPGGNTNVCLGKDLTVQEKSIILKNFENAALNATLGWKDKL